MLSGKVNENGGKTTMGLISKKAAKKCTLFCTFLCRCFAQIQRETSINFLVKRFMKKCRTCFCFFFSLPLIFTVVAASISHFLTAATKFSCCSSNKKMSIVFYLSLQLSVALLIVERRWSVTYFLFFSVFLFLYIPNLWT